MLDRLRKDILRVILPHALRTGQTPISDVIPRNVKTLLVFDAFYPHTVFKGNSTIDKDEWGPEDITWVLPPWLRRSRHLYHNLNYFPLFTLQMWEDLYDTITTMEAQSHQLSEETAAAGILLGGCPHYRV